MIKLNGTRHWSVAILLTLIAVLATPVISFAQGRGRGNTRRADLDWKCGKFVNCHDARDGRRDGRGPRGSRVGRRIWDDDDNDRGRGVRRGNRARIDRDGDGDFDRDDVRLGRRQNRQERFERRSTRRSGRWNR